MKKIFLILLLISLLGFGSYTVYERYQDHQEAVRQRILAEKKLEKRKAAWRALKQELGLEIAKFEGEAGIVIKDLELNWEASLNKDKLFPSASVVKIPIMATCFYAAQAGRIKLEDIVKLKSSGRVSGSGVLKNMKAGTEFSVEKLIELMISCSDNTATNMLIGLLGFDYFNNSFQKNGLKNTNLSRKMMDFKQRREGVENYTTAEDMGYLLEKIYRRELISKDVSEKCLELLGRQKINDRIPAKLPQGITVAHKTGLERKICHDAGIVFTPRGDYLICVLTKDAEKAKTAKEFIAEIALLTHRYFEQL